MRNFVLSSMLLCVGAAHAQLQSLPDSELSQVRGGDGIGFVLDNFKLDASDLKIVINEITNASGQNIPITVDRFYVAAAGSNKGTNLKPVSIGRLPYPINLNLAKGEDLRTLINGNPIQTTPSGVAVTELAFPTQLSAANGGQPCITGVTGNNTCSSRSTERFDTGMRFEFQVNETRTDILTVDLGDVVLDGSYMRVWGDSVNQQMVGEARVNVFAKTLDVMSCKAGGLNCTSTSLQNERTLQLTDIRASIALGYGKSQPILFDVSSDGQFVLELPNPVRTASNPNQAIDTRTGEGLRRANDFYTNAPSTNLSIGNLNAGGTRASPSSVPFGGYNFGTNEITGMRFNYLKVTSRAL